MTRSSLACLVLCGVLATSAGCLFAQTPIDLDGPDDSPAYKAMILRFENEGEPVFYDRFGTPLIEVLRGGQPLMLDAPRCNCDQECPVGGSLPAPEVAYLANAQAYELPWDGSYWEPKPGEPRCYRKRFMPKGELVAARFCAASRYNAPDSARSPLLKADGSSWLDCAEQTFEVGQTSPVVHKRESYSSALIGVRYQNITNVAMELQASCEWGRERVFSIYPVDMGASYG